MVTLASLWLLAVVPFFSDAACNSFLTLLFLGSGALLGLFWVAVSIGRPSLLRPPAAKWWFMVPIAGLMGLFLLVSDRDLALRVWLCEEVLQNRVDDVNSGNNPERAPGWVGLFHVDDTRCYDGGTYLYTSSSFINRHGVAHVPPGCQPMPRTRIKQLYGPWYSFESRY
jgi:hypothetical protein